uniref:Uncharacterized protein n=1 Tax=Anopheles albimanus TaxID=7167 RepID=A0A182FZB8_ANOAL
LAVRKKVGQRKSGVENRACVKRRWTTNPRTLTPSPPVCGVRCYLILLAPSPSEQPQ